MRVREIARVLFGRKTVVADVTHGGLSKAAR
jgi:hypothetical protein